MPLYEAMCPTGHRDVFYVHRACDRDSRTYLCARCGSSMVRVLSFGRGLTFFSQKRPQTITNLGHDPVTITSPAQHEAAMRQAGVGWAAPRRGMPGCWS